MRVIPINMRIVIFPDLWPAGGFCGYIDGKRFLRTGTTGRAGLISSRTVYGAAMG